MAKASSVVLGIQNGTSRTMYATWVWKKDHTDHYHIKWYYATGDGVWFVGEDSTVTVKQSTYSAPENATKVKFVVKPIAKTHKVKKKKTVYNKKTKKTKTSTYSTDVSYWTADWSTAKEYKFRVDRTPATPSVPTVSIDKFKLTAEVDSYDSNTKQIEFYVVKNDKTKIASGKATLKTHHASFSCAITAGGEYKVKCRGIGDAETGPWSEYSANVGTVPEAPVEIIKAKTLSATSVRIDWPKVRNATSYDIQYTTEERYFDSSNEVQSMSLDAQSLQIGSLAEGYDLDTTTQEKWKNVGIHHAEVTGLESGRTWYFRVRATNEKGSSAWSDIYGIVVGAKPSAPTTWSSTTTGVVGEKITLYWVHNSEDGSEQKAVEIKFTLNMTDGSVEEHTASITGNTSNLDISEYTRTGVGQYFPFDLADVLTVEWQVRTKGVIDTYSNWSTNRIIQILIPPTLSLAVSKTNNWLWNPFNFETDNVLTATGEPGDMLSVLTSFPFYVFAYAAPASQNAVSFYLSIIANEAYDTVDAIGNVKYVKVGDQIFGQYYDATSNNLTVMLSAGDLTLENNKSYTLNCVVSMDSGLTASASAEFTVEWEEDSVEPDAEIGIDEDILCAYIRPYCEDDEGNLVKDVLLSVYRREFDGNFTEIATDLQNEAGTFVTDPHPALDYARYRIVAMSLLTGAISFYDAPGYPVEEPSIVIQWDEEWSTFDVTEEDEREEPNWAGSMLRLPYNVDVADSHDPDVALVEYIGRKHPVSYYGTQLGESATWNTEIEKDDRDTLYAIRRLAVYSGDVYVREPSGSGYWAHITVSFSQKHRELTIPITLNIKRVEGGM